MRRDLYQEVTNKIIAAITAGADGDNWSMPWHGSGAHGMPHNAVTGHRYRGVNVVMLWAQAQAAGHQVNQWASYKQWQSRGAQVRKAERGTLIIYYGATTVRDPSESGDDAERQIRFIKCSRVFNAAQVDGYELPQIERPDLAQRLSHAERFVNATGAEILYDQGQAFYAPSKDVIGMPAWDTFKDTAAATATENAYGTLFHELTHWTRHETRLDRDFGRKRFGDDGYAVEELVAELGAAYLAAALGIEAEPRADHAQYIEQWLRVLKNDKKAIFTAAARASDAADYLEGFQGLAGLANAA